MLERGASGCVSSIKLSFRKWLWYASLTFHLALFQVRQVHFGSHEHAVFFTIRVFTFFHIEKLYSGLALTCADSGCLRLKMAGPPGLLSFWDSAAAFTHRKHQELVIDEVRDDRSFDTGEIIVEAIPLVCQEENTNIKLGSTAATPAPTHICYVCHTKSLPGRFDVQRAKAMGPMFAKLKAGLNVILEDGSTVQSRDVMGASEPPRYVAIICDIASLYDDMNNVEVCGTSSLLERLVSNPYWSRYVRSMRLLAIAMINFTFHTIGLPLVVKIMVSWNASFTTVRQQ